MQKGAKMRVFLGILAFVFVGCTPMTELTAGGKRVQIVVKEPQNCKRLGEVEGYKDDVWSTLSLKSLKNSAKNDLKNNAAAMGADTVLLISGDSGGTSGSGVISYGVIVSSSHIDEYHIEGIAYKCK